MMAQVCDLAGVSLAPHQPLSKCTHLCVCAHTLWNILSQVFRGAKVRCGFMVGWVGGNDKRRFKILALKPRSSKKKNFNFLLKYQL